MPLDQDLHVFLLQLERAQADGGEWLSIADVADIPSKQREIAVSKGWVKQKGFGNLAQYKILPAGYSALGSNAEFVLKQLTGDNIEILAVPAEPAPVANVKTCREPGCNEPRHLNYKRCKAHQQAIWRANSAVQRGAASPNRKRRSAPATQPSASYIVIDEPTFADEDTQPDLQPVAVESIADTPPVLTRLLARAVVKLFVWKVS